MSKKLKIILGVSGAVTGAAILSIGLGVGFYQAKETSESRKNIAKANDLYNEEAELKDGIAKAKQAIIDADAVIAAKGSSSNPDDIDAVDEAIKTKEESKQTIKDNTEALKDLPAKLLKALEAVAQSVNVSLEQQKMTADYLVRFFNLVRSKERLKNPGTAPTAKVVSEMSTFYQEYIDKIKQVDESNLNADSLAWKRAMEFGWENAQGNYKQNLQLLFSTFNWGSSAVFPASHFSGLMDDVLSNSNSAANKEIFENWLVNAKDAVAKKMVLSKVFLKLHMEYILSNSLSDEVLEFAQGTDSSKKVVDLITGSSKLSTEAKDFLSYYVTTYYQASATGLGENLPELILYKANNYPSPNQTSNADEVEGVVKVVDPTSNVEYKVFGVGLTTNDLNQQKVGLGFVTGTGDVNGANMYKQILKTQTTSSDTPKQVNKDGYDTTKKAVDNFKIAAQNLADLIVGSNKEWTTTITYDEDGLKPKASTSISVTIRDAKGNINYQEFIKWLNQEKFFFGREDTSYWTPAVKSELTSNPELTKYVQDLKDKNYDRLIEPAEANKAYGSITNEQFYYGALSAFKGYQEFKDATQKYGASFFSNPVPDYGVETYPYSARDYTGVGSYNGRVKKFQFNVDPYLSLPKWSVTSFANHESMMGHHNQIMYADKYLTNVDGIEFGNNFGYTSYIEGWALFMEWFGIEAGFYGTPDYENGDYYAAPTDFSISKGITSFFTTNKKAEVTDEMVNKIKDLHNGIYWDIAGQSVTVFKDDKEKALVANKIANILQYCGALNEAQLRNMRRAVDTALHSQDVENHTDLPAGASLQQVRDFMKANSALGIGDIQSESKRYLAYVGQATSYNAGKAEMLNLYKEVIKTKGLTREKFINDKKAVSEFFDRLLLNGGLPLDALKASVNLYYGIEEK